MNENKTNIGLEEKEEVEFLAPNYPTSKKYENITFAERLYAIPKNRPVRIYCDGVFDMFHYGHGRLFAQVKQLFPNVHLIAGVHSDAAVRLNKGDMVMSEDERYECISQCRYVDELIEDAPWVNDDLSFFKKHKIDYLAHDEAPYPSANSSDIYGFAKSQGMFIPTKRATDISTTKIITGIIKNYNLYLRRQILRGISHKELNLSYLTFQFINFKFKTIENCRKITDTMRYFFNSLATLATGTPKHGSKKASGASRRLNKSVKAKK